MTQLDAADLLANQGVNIGALSVRREALQRKLDGLTDQFNAEHRRRAVRQGITAHPQRTCDRLRQLADATRTSPAAALVAAGASAWEVWQATSPTQRAQAVDEIAVVTIKPCPPGSPWVPQRLRGCRLAARRVSRAGQRGGGADVPTRPFLAVTREVRNRCQGAQHI